jgi:hypothetical protein
VSLMVSNGAETPAGNPEDEAAVVVEAMTNGY